MAKSNWEKRIIYQIYPRSFKDSNADGVGDLNGISEKLPYLKQLGVNAIWISPIYRSPMHDFGYDISDYRDIDPIFGNLANFDNLVKKAHLMDIKVLMDFVPNHTSSEHSWFKESRKTKNNPKRDWYIWRLPKKNGKVPNNWLSHFGGSAWELDRNTGEYYLHTFDVSQPDLNWRNPKVVEEMLSTLRYWMEKGVDGFRVDSVYFLFKDPFFRDEPENPTFLPENHRPYDRLFHIYTIALPETLQMLKKFNEVINEFDDRFMVCEIYTFLHEIANLYRIVDHRSFAPFNFSFISIPWNAMEQKKFLDEFDEVVGHDYFPTYVLGNHDQPRAATRLGEKGARTAALLQLTLRGIPFIYYGEELGMRSVEVPQEKARDPMAVNLKGLNFGRDPERTPMQWDTSAHAGFSKVEPWLPLEKDYREKNVESEDKDAKSFLSLYRKLIKLREELPGLSKGDYHSLDLQNQNVFGFIRQYKDEKVLILVNFAEDGEIVKLPKGGWKTILSTESNMENRKEKDHINLRPSEGVILTN